ncbi:sigma-70 family RNA polymerase sigma factor [bacterium]|nr:sigma-70 family RNA polymerase sigma factor [bacterium]
MGKEIFNKEIYDNLWIYFRYLYFKKGWYSAFNGEKSEEFIREIFHGALIKNSKIDKDGAEMEEILAPFIFNPQKFSNEKAYKGFLAQIFNNHIIDIVREKQSGLDVENDENIEEKSSSENSMDFDLINEDLKNIAIKLATFEFNREEKEILSLYFNENMSYSAIGKTIGLSLSSVERRIKKMFLKIKIFIEKQTSAGNYSDDDRTAILSYFLNELKVEFENEVRKRGRK